MPARTVGTRSLRDTGSHKAHLQRGVLKAAAEIDALTGSPTGDDDDGLSGPCETIGPESQGKESPKLGAKRSASDSILPPTKKRRITERSCRGPTFAQRLKRRSGNKCELSGRTQDMGLATDGAHIFGIQSSAGERAKAFWNLLYMFWNPLIVRKLRAACTQHINSMSNGITMDCSTHALYDQLRFYLEVLPDSYSVSGDKAQYTVKIRFPRSPIILYNHWKDTGHMSDGTPGVSLLTDGDEITFKTNDQKNCPLPDPVLLQVRAILTKCAFFRGGADREDEVMANELRGEEIRTEQNPASINNGHYSCSDEDLNDEEGLCARDREEKILEDEPRNEPISAAQKAALIGNAHYPDSDEDLNEEEEMSDRNREYEILEDQLRNEQIWAAQKAALIGNAHYPDSHEDLNEEEQLSDRNREDAIFQDELRNEQIRAAQQAALIDDAHDTYSDDYLNDEEEFRARDREDEILEIELRNEQIRAAQKAALIGNADYPYSDEDLNEEEELSDRNREDAIFEDELRNEQIRAAHQAALIDDVHDTYSDAYLNEEEQLSDRNREDAIFQDELRNEEVKAAQTAALIDKAHYTPSDDYLNEDHETHDPPGVINVSTDDAIAGDIDWNARLESWLEHTPPVDRGLLDGGYDDTPGEDGQPAALHASGISR
jgi:hypothetical protein